MMHGQWVLMALVALGTALARESVGAEEMPSGPYPRAGHEIALGVTSQKAESTVLSSVGELPPVGIDLRDLNIEGSHESVYLAYRWRFRPRWLLSAFAYRYEDNGRGTASFDFNYDGVEYEVGAAIDSKLTIDTYVVDVLYAAFQNERAELLIGGGMHALDLGVSLNGSLTAGGETIRGSASSEAWLAPVPNLRLQGTYMFTRRFGADVTVGWLSADVDEYEGDFLYMNAHLRYRFLPRASISLGYQFTEVDVTQRPSDGKKRVLDADIFGPTLQLTYSF